MRSSVVALFLGSLALSATPLYAQAKPAWQSKLVTSQTPGHAVEVDVDISGAEELYLVVTDGGNGFACDWADWAEPRLTGPKGERKLTELRWKSADSDWGKTAIGRNAGGGTLKIDGKEVSYGIGAHANSVVHYELPEGYTRFKARAGLDNGGTDQGDGSATSVRFMVYLEKPPASVTRATPPGASGGRPPEEALAALEVAADLEATIFAAEPMMLNPTNIDIDHLGRVWVCEVVNYRQFRNQDSPPREEGDRLLILEDTDADGQADRKTVFYQGRDIDSAHGVCVLGTPSGKNTRAIVSAGDSVFVFTDKDGDLKADEKRVLFTGISGVQHDHGIHAFVFGPDGKLYFNFGNEGKQIKTADGATIVDMAGNEVNDRRRPYQQGMVFRCDLDGSQFETLGWNFRNNWEVCTDSFGTLWQSDNDDDGNRGVRINYVMEFGNYGYRDELTGAGWRDPRTGMSDEVPLRHWHLNDPGVVPNLLQTGAGSPTGICVYEGTLLPKVFHNQVIHCDAGPNVVRAYPVEPDGAGYRGETVNLLYGAGDKWFRPSDVCVAPDGSLLIADWYDPGVGGHRMADVERGRLFRVAPPDTAYKTPTHDFSTAEGAVETLKSPNLATRYVAWQALNQMQAGAEAALSAVFEKSDDQRLRARALWLLANIEVCGQHYIDAAAGDDNPDIRITALRAARQLRYDVPGYIRKLSRDSSPQVRRECAIALRGIEGPEAAALWAELALKHDGQDRWYLEALGIAARGSWNACLDAWLEKVGDDWDTPAGRDIVWRSRGKKTPALLATIIRDEATSRDELPRYFRAFDFQDPDNREAPLAELAFHGDYQDPARRAFILAESLKRLGSFDVANRPEQKQALDRALDALDAGEEYISLVTKFNVADRYPQLLKMAQTSPNEQLGVEAIRALLAKGAFNTIQEGLNAEDEKLALATAEALGNSADGRVVRLLRPLMNDTSRPLELRRQAARGLAKTRNGAGQLIALAREGKLPQELKFAAAFELHLSPVKEVKSAAEELFPLPAAKGEKALPPISELLKMKGDVRRGAEIFAKEGTCAKCHKVDGQGKEVGPDLSGIGAKLTREALFESILYPSAGISHNYESYTLVTADGNIVAGLVTSQTPDSVTVVAADGISRAFPRSDIEQMEKQKISLMPADLQKLLTPQDLADVVAYCTTLKKAQASE